MLKISALRLLCNSGKTNTPGDNNRKYMSMCILAYFLVIVVGKIWNNCLIFKIDNTDNLDEDSQQIMGSQVPKLQNLNQDQLPASA